VVVIDTKAPAADVLQQADIAVGTGAEVVATSTVTAHYVGYGAMTGQMFDGSWSNGSPVEFPLANVITGWQEGLLGMKVGGRRVLVIPSSMGYGSTPPQGSGILSDENLVFVVDLTAVN
jgi:peptidylprolyl isomerase